MNVKGRWHLSALWSSPVKQASLRWGAWGLQRSRASLGLCTNGGAGHWKGLGSEPGCCPVFCGLEACWGWHGFVCPDFSAMFTVGGTFLWEAYDKEALLSSSASAVAFCSLLPGSFLSSFCLRLPPLPYISSLFLFKGRFYVFEYLPTCVYVHCVSAWCPRRPEDGVRSPGTGVKDSYVLLN